MRATATGPGRLDRAGFAGLLWRGAPLVVRPPIAASAPRDDATALNAREAAGVVGQRASQDDALRAIAARTSNAGFAVLTNGGHASLALLGVRRLTGGSDADAFTMRWPHADEGAVAEAGRMARPLGASHHVIGLEAVDPVAALGAWLATTALPTADGFEAHLVDRALERAGATAAKSTGGAALFGLGEPFESLHAHPLRWLDRSRPPRIPPDPFDLPSQRAMEREALARVPVHAAQAALSLLPAATRAAISTTGERPPDGTPKTDGPPVVAMAEAALAAAIDRTVHAPSARTTNPYLDREVIAIARRLPARARFGRPGSGGCLVQWLRRAQGWAERAPVEGFERTLDVWLRGPLAPWLANVLASSRIEPQGVWRTEGVARAVACWRERAPGWTARVIFVLALAAAWLHRDGLSAPS